VLFLTILTKSHATRTSPNAEKISIGESKDRASGMRSGTSRAFTRPPSSQRAFSSRPFLHDGFRGNRFRDRDRFRTYGYNNCYGYACRGYGYGYGYPWAYSGYYDPYWWWDSSSSSNDDSYNQDVAQAAEMNRENLEEQRMMRQEQADGDQDAYAHSVPPATTRHDAEGGAPALPDTVLVFRDQHKQEISNYAIVGQTLYNFAPQHTQKIPLSDLDLPATTKANDERGLTFRIPAAGEAQ